MNVNVALCSLGGYLNPTWNSRCARSLALRQRAASFDVDDRSLARCVSLCFFSRAVRPNERRPMCSERVRTAALVALERWNERFGDTYAQIGAAMAYVGSSLRIELPSVREREF